MKILMVSPYPPARDGIGAYAVQSVARLRAEGHEVEVLSPSPSAAHFHLHLVGPRGALALAKRVRRYDKVIVHFHPDVFFPVGCTPGQWRVESLALAVPFLAAREIEVLVHEIDYTRGAGRLVTRLANRLPWRFVTRVVVHTEPEAVAFAQAFGLPRDRIVLAPHGADFRRFTDLSKAEARATLGLPARDTIFLNIGFIQPHKGFDRSVRAVAKLAAAGAGGGYRLDIVGSVRTNDPAHRSYLDELRGLVEATPAAFLHEGYVSPELFDRWLAASDVVVLPYRSIWSSSVLERALLYDCHVIATDVGGLSSQATDRSRVTFVDGDLGLWRAMRDVVTPRRAPSPGDGEGDGAGDDGADRAGPANGDHGDRSLAARWSWADADAADRTTIQDEIRRRAGLTRSWAGPQGTNGASGGECAPRSAPLRAVVPLLPEEPGSRFTGGRAAKRMLGRLLSWEIDPLYRYVNTLRQATIDALDADRRPPRPPSGSEDATAGADHPATPQLGAGAPELDRPGTGPS